MDHEVAQGNFLSFLQCSWTLGDKRPAKLPNRLAIMASMLMPSGCGHEVFVKVQQPILQANESAKACQAPVTRCVLPVTVVSQDL